MQAGTVAEYKKRMEEAVAELARERRDLDLLEARFADVEASLAAERRDKAEQRRAASTSSLALETEREAAEALRRQVAELEEALAAAHAGSAVCSNRICYSFLHIWPRQTVMFTHVTHVYIYGPGAKGNLSDTSALGWCPCALFLLEFALWSNIYCYEEYNMLGLDREGMG